MTTKHLRNAFAIALLATTALAAGCSGGDTTAEHAAAGNARSSAGLPTGHADAGEQLAHRRNEKTGQAAPYLVNALTEYQHGQRKHPTMQAQAESFSAQDIADIAAYLSSLK